MLEFNPVTLQDRPWIHDILFRAGRQGCEFSFVNLYFWMRNSGGVCRFEDFLLKESIYDGKRGYLFPAGEGEVCRAVSALKEHSEAHGAPLMLWGVTDRDRLFLEHCFPEKFRFEVYRNGFDYLYPIEKLTTLSGKKLQSKRNHINRFLDEHPGWHTVPMTAQNAADCQILMDAWYEKHDSGKGLETEKAALHTAMSNFDALEMDGLFLYDGDTLLAFTMGNRLNETTFDVNFEKADADVQGAYPLINREFARLIADRYPNITTLNREDDMGIEGLRKAKESYHPDLLVKYRAYWEG